MRPTPTRIQRRQPQRVPSGPYGSPNAWFDQCLRSQGMEISATVCNSLCTHLMLRPDPMRNILTADQFLTSVLAMMKLSGSSRFLDDASLDYHFERAYETLLEQEKALKVTPNFTFFRDPLHGNSAKLRNALLAAKENGLLMQDTGKRFTYSVTMDEKIANMLLDRSPLTKKFLKGVVREHFSSTPESASS